MVGLRRVRTAPVVCIVMVAVTLAGCGRRGRLEPPPDPNAPPRDTVTKSGVHQRARNPPITAPHDSFILDPIL